MRIPQVFTLIRNSVLRQISEKGKYKEKTFR